jgi:hypothetical protein
MKGKTRKMLKKILGFSILGGMGIGIIALGGWKVLIVIGVTVGFCALISLAGWLICGEDE